MEFIAEGGIRTVGPISLNFRMGCNSAALRLNFKWRGKVIKIGLATECSS